ncbi:DEP domain-containing protein 1B isoform X1 [Ambystoma mexicanum]|uniref:DEP domain-containing protein 1B isoform X1 n=1 Tax=Ambystoma mexicanum TaxID=8296 RepID=UPI0037E7E55E
MEHKIIGPGPYRATKLWNETIELFRARMPLRRHRIHFKTYDNCFAALEAIDCLHNLLRDNQNFGPDVTRHQTIQLLKKFKKNHVIEDVKGRWGHEDFEDNGYLYRFPPTSPLKPYPKRPHYRADVIRFPDWSEYEAVTSNPHTSMKPIVMNSEMWYKRHSIAIGEVPACRLVQRRALTDANVEDLWKTMTLTHLQKILGLHSMDGVLDSKYVNPKHIIYNVYNTNKQGVVVLEEKSKELPHWVLSAMKCLANWPSSTDLNRPMYLGFEKDVFKTIADYHSEMKEPLLTFQLFDVFVNILALSGFVSMPLQTSKRNLNKKHAPHIQQIPDGNTTASLLSSTSSIENLMLSLSSKTSHVCRPADRSLHPQVRSNQGHLERRGTKGLHPPSKSTHPFCSLQRERHYQSAQFPVCSTDGTEPESGKENEFCKSHPGGSLQSLREFRSTTANPWVSTYRYFSIDNLPAVDDLEQKYVLRSPSVGSFPMKAEAKARSSAEVWKRTQSARYLPTLHEISSPTSVVPSSNCKACKEDHCRGFMSMVSLNADTSATGHAKRCPSWHSERAGSLTPLPVSNSGSIVPNKFQIDALKNTLKDGRTISLDPFSVGSLDNRNIVNRHAGSKSMHKCSSMPSLLQKKQVAVEALQVCCLLLPPENRRKLQLLMRMMAKISLNREIPPLCESVGTRMLMVQTFSRCILCSRDEVDLDELLASRLVTFMMDNYQEILKVPVSLQTAVEDHVAHLRRVQIKYPGSDLDTTIPTHSFCRQISADEFEYQKVNNAQEPLATLLEEIIMNKKLSTKDKKKKLKQFQKSYPEVYRKRLPTPECEAALFPEKAKLKPQLMFFTLKNPFQPFHRTRSFRM